MLGFPMFSPFLFRCKKWCSEIWRGKSNIQERITLAETFLFINVCEILCLYSSIFNFWPQLTKKIGVHIVFLFLPHQSWWRRTRKMFHKMYVPCVDKSVQRRAFKVGFAWKIKAPTNSLHSILHSFFSICHLTFFLPWHFYTRRYFLIILLHEWTQA